MSHPTPSIFSPFSLLGMHHCLHISIFSLVVHREKSIWIGSLIVLNYQKLKRMEQNLRANILSIQSTAISTLT